MLRGWLQDNVSVEVSSKTRIIYGGTCISKLLKKSREHSRTFEKKKIGNARFLLIHYFQLSAMLRLMKYNTSLSKKLQYLELVLRSMLREERVFLSVLKSESKRERGTKEL